MPRVMTMATSAHLSSFMRDPYPSGCVKEQFRAPSRPYGARWCLPRDGHGATAAAVARLLAEGSV
jgi:hypothetical protein